MSPAAPSEIHFECGSLMAVRIVRYAKMHIATKAQDPMATEQK
jgi:hypothetical protein